MPFVLGTGVDFFCDRVAPAAPLPNVFFFFFFFIAGNMGSLTSPKHAKIIETQ